MQQDESGRRRPSPARPAADSSDAGRFLVGTASLYGADMALTVVLTWSVLRISHSPPLAAVALILNGLPQVLTGILGPARMGAGHHPARLVLICGALLLGLGATAGATGRPEYLLALLLLAALIEGLGNAAAVPVAQAWWMRRADPGAKVRAARDYEIASRLPRILAPVAGSLLLVAGRLAPALAVVGLGFMLAGWSWRGRLTMAGASFRPLAWSEGRRALARDRWLLSALLLRGLSNLLWPAYAIGLPWLVMTRFHQSPLTFGLITTLYGLSTIALAWTAGRLKLTALGRGYMAAWALTGFGFVMLAQSPDIIWVYLSVLFIGLGSPFIHMALDAHIGSAIPGEQQASVFAFQRFVMGVAGLVGLYGVGWLLESQGTTAVLTATGLGIVAATIIAAISAERARASSVRPL